MSTFELPNGIRSSREKKRPRDGRHRDLRKTFRTRTNSKESTNRNRIETTPSFEIDDRRANEVFSTNRPTKTRKFAKLIRFTMFEKIEPISTNRRSKTNDSRFRETTKVRLERTRPTKIGRRCRNDSIDEDSTQRTDDSTTTKPRNARRTRDLKRFVDRTRNEVEF